MRKTCEILGFGAVESISEELLKERESLGVSSTVTASRKYSTELTDLDRECFPAYCSRFESEKSDDEHTQVLLEKTALKGVDIGFAALRMVQKKQSPEYIRFGDFDVPRPLVFLRELAVIRGFWYVFEKFGQQASDVHIPKQSPKSLDQVLALPFPRTVIQNENDRSVRLIACPNPEPYASNMKKDEAMMFVYDPGDLSEGAYEYLSQVLSA